MPWVMNRRKKEADKTNKYAHVMEEVMFLTRGLALSIIDLLNWRGCKCNINGEKLRMVLGARDNAYDQSYTKSHPGTQWADQEKI